MEILFLFFCFPSISYSYSIEQSLADKLSNPSYFNYEQLTEYFYDVSEKHSDLVKLHSIGKSVENRNIWAIEISENVAERALLKPMVKYVANMHGDETLGRQFLVYLLDYFLENYGKDANITRLINQTDIFLVPSLNPDGFEASQVSFKVFTFLLMLYYELQK